MTNRWQATRVNGSLSGMRAVATGVPQGSTLGPLLFTIFVNDFPLISLLLLFTLFADDTAMTVRGRDLPTIEAILNPILQLCHIWCNENQLTLNTSKTEYVVFASKQKRVRAGNITLRLGGDVLREVPTYKYLGTVLDSNLTGLPQQAKVNQLMA